MIIENIFYAVLYSIFGSIFLSFYFQDTLALFINGNGGFVGNYLNSTYLNKLIIININVSFYFLLTIITILFLLSINFSPKKIWSMLKKIFYSINKNKNYTDKSEIINEYIPQEEIKNLIQEDLPFIKAEKIRNDTKEI